MLVSSLCFSHSHKTLLIIMKVIFIVKIHLVAVYNASRQRSQCMYNIYKEKQEEEAGNVSYCWPGDFTGVPLKMCLSPAGDATQHCRVLQNK